jgi:ABC-type multidrug transport system fused ATPase/permease subunit
MVMQYSIEAYVQLIGQKEVARMIRSEFSSLGGTLLLEEDSFSGEGFPLELYHGVCTFLVEKGSSATIQVPSLRIDKGARIGIFGPSGSGKTTLFHMLLNTVEWEGTLTLAGKRHDRTLISPQSITCISSHDDFFPLSLRDN